MEDTKLMSKLGFIYSQSKVLSVVILFLGIGVLGLVGFVVWKDLTFYAKTDLADIFLENRTGQPIGIGLVYYFLVGISLFGVGLFLILRKRISKILSSINMSQMTTSNNAAKSVSKTVTETRHTNESKFYPQRDKRIESPNEERFFSGCRNHFGYLANRSKDTPIPPECIVCQRLGDCMVATIYVEK